MAPEVIHPVDGDMETSAWVWKPHAYLRQRRLRGVSLANMAYSRYWISVQRHRCIDWTISGHSPAQRDMEGHRMRSG